MNYDLLTALRGAFEARLDRPSRNAVSSSAAGLLQRVSFNGRNVPESFRAAAASAPPGGSRPAARRWILRAEAGASSFAAAGRLRRPRPRDRCSGAAISGAAWSLLLSGRRFHLLLYEDIKICALIKPAGAPPTEGFVKLSTFIIFLSIMTIY